VKSRLWEPFRKHGARVAIQLHLGGSKDKLEMMSGARQVAPSPLGIVSSRGKYARLLPRGIRLALRYRVSGIEKAPCRVNLISLFCQLLRASP
jgi:hypothetical protein